MKKILSVTLAVWLLWSVLLSSVLPIMADASSTMGTYGNTYPDYNLWTTNRRADEVEDIMYRPAAGYSYTGRGFVATGADFTNTNPYLNVETNQKVNVKDGLYMEIAIDDFSYRGKGNNQDEWISFNLWSEPTLYITETGYGQGYVNLCRSDGKGASASVENWLTTDTTFGNLISGPPTTPVYNNMGKEIWTFEVVYDETQGYTFLVNGTAVLAQNEVYNQTLEAIAPDGMFYVGVVLHSTEKDGKAALSVMKYGDSKEDARLPMGYETKAPEVNPWDRDWVCQDPATVPENMPALMWDASKSCFSKDPSGTNLMFAAQSDLSYRVTATSNLNYFPWVISPEFSYDGRDFPVLAMFVRNFSCAMGSVFPCAGNVVAPNTDSFLLFDRDHPSTQYYGLANQTGSEKGDTYALVFVDIGGQWNGRIHQLRIGFDALDMESPTFDIMYMGLFRSEAEAVYYTDSRYGEWLIRGDLGEDETESMPEEETSTEEETTTESEETSTELEEDRESESNTDQEIKRYTVTFRYENGDVYRHVTYAEGTTQITEPSVPHKEGYAGRWEYYSLNGNTSVFPLYTKIQGGNGQTDETVISEEKENPFASMARDMTSGCYSSVGVGAPAVIAVALLSAVILKKKE